jgi:hypothetical protein
VLFKVEENPVSRRFLKEIVASLVRKDADCWESDRNKDKRPSNYKSNADKTDKSDDKKKLHCTYCNKDGHTMDLCFRKKRNEKKDDKQGDENLIMIAIDGSEGQNVHREMSFIHKVDHDIDKAHLHDKCNMSSNTFIFDSGATSHMMHSKEELTNLRLGYTGKCLTFIK